MNFAEQPPSKQWAALKYGGAKFAEVWFKPAEEPFGLTFRIPRQAFQAAGMAHVLTIANLLKAVGVATEEVESWRYGADLHSGMDGANHELGNPLPAPPEDVAQLSVHVRLTPPAPPDGLGESSASPQVDVASESGEPQNPVRKWQDIEARWAIILGVEASINSLRQTVEGLQGELQTALKRTLNIEEKVHARNMDLAQWNKEKNRVHFALPKVKEFIHRATWSLGTPERKALAVYFEDEFPKDMPHPEMNKLAEQLEFLLKDRQVLSAQGAKVCQECRSIAQDIQGALRTVQSNAAANAAKKRRAASAKSKFFKDVRRLSGAD